MSDPVAHLESLLTDQPASPLRPEQRRNYEGELQRLGAIAQAPLYVQGDRGEAMKRYREIKRTVDAQVPKPLGERANQVYKLTKAIIFDLIKPAMLPQNVMRRMPPGSVDAFLKRENAKPIKRAVATVKRALFGLDPETDDIDHANLEKYRPSGLKPDGTSTWDSAAQIDGFLAMSPLAKENWPLGEPTASTALAQVKAAEIPQVRAGRRPMSPEERKALGERLAKGRLAKKAKAEAALQ